MNKIKELENDFRMYDGAVKDLEMNDGDEAVIVKLKRERQFLAQALNMMRCSQVRTKRIFVFSDLTVKNLSQR